MQKPTDIQLDEKVSGKIDKNVPETVRSILSTDLNPQCFKKQKKQKVSKKVSVPTGNVERGVDKSETSTLKVSNQQQVQAAANQTPAIAVNQAPIIMNPTNTMMDASGQQFYMVPVNSGPMPIQFQPLFGPPRGMYHGGRSSGRE